MRKIELRECSYTILLSVSLITVACAWQFGGLKEQNPKEIGAFLEETIRNVWSEFGPGKESESFLGEGFVEDVMVSQIDDSMTDEPDNEFVYEESKTDGETGETFGQEEMDDVVDMKTVEVYRGDISYFDDALFIGDSRTVGLYEYGGLGKAEVFAHSGMSIYKVFKEEFELRSGERVTLPEILHRRSFGKVYIMLGINELGYDFEQTVKRFEETITEIKETQPGAFVFIQANLHITDEKAEQSDIFNNENIDKYNQAIRELADGKNVFYLDANTLYDDENGCLSKEFTTDHAHILGKYYVEWVDFILQNAVRRK